jgi:hypothetical protein
MTINETQNRDFNFDVRWRLDDPLLEPFKMIWRCSGHSVTVTQQVHCATTTYKKNVTKFAQQQVVYHPMFIFNL